MPNGSDRSSEDWERLESPFKEIDEEITRFANDRNMVVIKNYHNWPSRFIQWLRLDIDRSIQILVADGERLTFHVSLLAWKDNDGRRYFAHKRLKTHAEWHEIKNNLSSLLQESAQTLDSWSELDLSPGR